MKTVKIGWASTNITPQRPLLMVGQMYHRVSAYVHDPITATALAIDSGDAQIILVSLDMTESPDHVLPLLHKNLRDVPEIDVNCISFSVTHTHNSSDFNSDFLREDNEQVFHKDILPLVQMDEEILYGEEAQRFLADRLADLIKSAWHARQPGGVSAAHEYACVAHNRRPMFETPEGIVTKMYGDCSADNFVGFEGGTDTSVELLYTWDLTRHLTGIVMNVPCPSQVYELHRFISADYWAYVREEIASSLDNVFILPLCGAAGDLAPLDLVRISKDNREELLAWGGQTKEVNRNIDMTLTCQQIARRLRDAALRGLKSARSVIDYQPVFMHETLHLRLPLRLVSKEEYTSAQTKVDAINKKFSKQSPMQVSDVVAAFEDQGTVLRWELQQKTEFFECISHIIRLGNIGIATNPFELFHDYGIRMKARVKADQLFIAQLSNGLGGYLPTAAAIRGGSYSSKAASSFCGPDAGSQLVEETLGVLNRFFSQEY